MIALEQRWGLGLWQISFRRCNSVEATLHRLYHNLGSLSALSTVVISVEAIMSVVRSRDIGISGSAIVNPYLHVANNETTPPL